jgi:hypothetical protein
LGAAAAYLVLAVIALRDGDTVRGRAIYSVLSLIGWFALVPLSAGALVTGLIQSLGTEWGLFRHYWIVLKLLLTVVGSVILTIHMRTVTEVSRAAVAAAPLIELGKAPTQLVVHAAGGVLVLLTATTLSVYKPFGRIAGLEGLRVRLGQRAALLAVGAIILFLALAHLAVSSGHHH